LEQESITLHKNKPKGKLAQLTTETETYWLKIKEAITKTGEESVGYKWENRKWIPMWNEEIQLATE